MKHLDIIDIFKDKDSYIGGKVTVCGWIRTTRDSKNISFLELNDGTALKSLQVVVDTTAISVSNITLGTAVKIEGVAVKSVADASGIEVNAGSIEILGECPPEYPIQKKRHTLEYLRTIPHFRVRTNTFNAMFRLRSKISFAVHQFFNERNYSYVHTPIITGSDCEGAGEVFKVTTIGYNPAIKSEEEYNAKDFFGKKAGLTVSGQLEGEVMAMALGKIYTFGPTFRAENSNTARHAAEFWQIEPEVAFAEIGDIMDIAADLIKYLINYALDKCAAEMEFFEKHFEPGLTAKLKSVADSQFVRLDYTKAIEILIKSGVKFEYPVEWGCDLMTEHERYLVDTVYKCPVFVVNYPKELKSFYMKQNKDGKTVAATDLLVPGVGEIIGCSEREADLAKLTEAMKVRKMNMADYEYYMDLRKFGSVPHSGFGLGLERFLMYITGIGNIRDTVPYPRTKSELR